MPERKTVMISSTARDLPEHRKQVQEACMRLDMFYPEMMEHLTATDADAKQVSLAMVEKADIYLGVFGFRFGYVPEKDNPGKISVTEMEYNRAVERKIPRLIFLMGDDHPVLPKDVETGDGAERLRRLKDRLKTERVVGFFRSPDDLRAQVIQALVPYREPDLTTFHYISDIPAAPEAYIAHPYTLLQTHRLVGRQAELNLLTDWVLGKTLGVSQTPRVSIFNIVAIGGMGKSALAWKWFNDIAPQEMRPLAGRMWWSFYESDATFENFVIRALAYVTGRAREDVEKNTVPGEREAQLLAALDRSPFLLVLDGLERILIAYARMDAARLADGQISNQRNLRKTADPRAGNFLRKLTQVRSSRILISSRLYPAELETETGAPIPGSFRRNITGLTDQDAVELWRAFGISGSRDELLPIFARFDTHPLLIQALAGEVKNHRRAPGDFAAWRKSNPNFDPARCARTQEAMAHVLEYALCGLEAKALELLRTIAAFRMPARYDTLAALLVPQKRRLLDAINPFKRPPAPSVFSTERQLDTVLVELEDRGLLGWDRRANRYDLHPIVRGVVWNALDAAVQRDVCAGLHEHFESLPSVVDWQQVERLEDLTPAIELYNTLIGMERYDDACDLFYERLSDATLYRLSASCQRGELLEALFPDGPDQVPRLSRTIMQAFTFSALAQSYQCGGQPGRAAPLHRRYISISESRLDKVEVSKGLCNLSSALCLAGGLRDAEAVARRALGILREQKHRLGEAISLHWLGWALATRGVARASESALRRSLRLFVAESEAQAEGVANSLLAQRALWFGDPAAALPLADRAWKLAHAHRFEGDIIRAARPQGEAALQTFEVCETSKVSYADERLHHALARARAVNLAEEELPALVALAELRRRQGDPKAARELLDDVWEPAERGPYPLFHADACNVLAQIERDAGNAAAAVEAATKAYRLAWCDGEPYAYHWGLVAARWHLAELGAAEPAMQPFDASKYEPMPEVEINPDDEFHVEEQ